MNQQDQLKEIINILSSRIGKLNIEVAAAEVSSKYWHDEYLRVEKELEGYRVSEKDTAVDSS